MTQSEIDTHARMLSELENLIKRVSDSRWALNKSVKDLNDAPEMLKSYFKNKHEFSKQAHAKCVKTYQDYLGLFIEKTEASEYLKLELLNQENLS